MNTLERDIKIFILRALLAAGGRPLTDEALKASIRNSFSVAFTAGDLNTYIRICEDIDLLSGTNHDVFGLMWALTPKGKITAQQLQ